MLRGVSRIGFRLDVADGHYFEALKYKKAHKPKFVSFFDESW